MPCDDIVVFPDSEKSHRSQSLVLIKIYISVLIYHNMILPRLPLLTPADSNPEIFLLQYSNESLLENLLVSAKAGAYWFGLLFPPLHLFLQPSPPSPVRDYSPGRPLLMDRLFVQEINI
ncbi:hypothetical protein X798_00668 [Onchocerca flexuosa]|uniref:Uncharacterized protein n=1 Tax=Onchocerca flexuosa TaxID=387005 RepID=A0A238C3W3_9BILA|nr:hypothetical protein X798_00668 [Onchocerca flexuosa]